MFPKKVFAWLKLHAKSAINVQKNGLKNLLRPTRASPSSGKQRTTEVQESGLVLVFENEKTKTFIIHLMTKKG
jgi:hypothetical protein